MMAPFEIRELEPGGLYDAPRRAGQRRQWAGAVLLLLLASTVQAERVTLPVGTADLETVEPFTDTNVVTQGAGGVLARKLPRYRVRHGKTADGATVVVVDRPDGSRRGFSRKGDKVTQFGADVAQPNATALFTAEDIKKLASPSGFCVNDLHPAMAAVPQPARMAMEALPTNVQREVVVAIETDTELWAKEGSEQATLDYLATLLGAVAGFYAAETNVVLKVGTIHLWNPSGSDPWTATSTGAALDEVRAYWNDPAHGYTAIPRTLVHFVSGKNVTGGIGYVNVLCAPQYAFAVSQVEGRFSVTDPSGYWDALVTMHEIGHNCGSPHSHCYQPPLDHCYSAESGCYNGPTECGPGFAMSYCHVCGSGMANITLAFGSVVAAKINATLDAATCLPIVGGGAPTTTTSTTTTRPATTSTTRAPVTSTTTLRPTTSTSTTRTTTTTVTATTRTTTTTVARVTTTTGPVTSGCRDARAKAAHACAMWPNTKRCRLAQEWERKKCH